MSVTFLLMTFLLLYLKHQKNHQSEPVGSAGLLVFRKEKHSCLGLGVGMGNDHKWTQEGDRNILKLDCAAGGCILFKMT